jgi:hypothetical protein
LSDHEQIEQLRMLTINHGLPKTDMALYDVRCPYCGKSDRIRVLETPGQLIRCINAADFDIYKDVWNKVAGPKDSLGLCKFCQHVVKLEKNGRAEPLAI